MKTAIACTIVFFASPTVRAVSVRDHFNRAGSGLDTNAAVSVGLRYALSQAGGDKQAQAGLSGGQVYFGATAGATNASNVVLLRTDTLLGNGADGESFTVAADIATHGVAAPSLLYGLAFNVQADGRFYAARINTGSANVLQFIRHDGTSGTGFGSAANGVPLATNAQYHLEISSAQPGVFDYRLAGPGLDGGELAGTVPEPLLALQGGRAGFYMSAANGGPRFDNLAIATFPQAPSPPPLVKSVPGPGAVPVLVCGGEIVAMDAFNAPADANPATREEFRMAASNGVEIVFLRRVCVSRNTGDGWFELDANILDQAMDEALADNPSARVVLNIGGLHPPGSWYAFHNQEPKLQDIDGNRSVFPDPHSPIYRGAAARYISNLVAYVEGQPYADSVAGYHISAFEGGEWMMPDGYWGYSDAMRTAFQTWLSDRYGTVAGLEAAWSTNGIGSFADVAAPVPSALAAADWGPFRDPGTRRPAIDFAEFWQDACSECLLAFCRTAKEASARDVKPLVGAFYGYQLETSQTFYKGHHALRKVLDSPWIDFLAAPYSYVYRSPAWLGVEGADIGAGMFHGPADSILANGKLFWTEDDSRTYLTDDDVKSHFTDEAGTIANLRRNQLASLVRGAGIWRLDLYGTGWYGAPGLMQEFGLQRHVNELVVRGADGAAGYVPDVALIIDEASSLHVATADVDNPRQRLAVNMFLRDHLARSGVGYGVYLLSDLVAGRVPDCSAYLFAGTYRLSGAERAWIEANLKRDGKTLVWLYGSGLYDESGWGLDRIAQLVGMDIAEAPDLAPSGIEPTAALVAAMGDSSWNNPGIAGHPEWHVQDVASGATVLANYVHGGTRRPAIVMEDKETWTSVYAGVLRLDARWLLGLVRLADIPQVLDTDATVPVYAGRGMVGIWPTTHLVGTVRLKELSDVYDLHTGSLLHQGVESFPVDLAQWQTAGFKIQPAGQTWWPGLFLEWQLARFQVAEITAGLADAAEDPDGDGASNHHEFVAGTDPRDALSRFAVSSIHPADGPDIVLAYDTATNRNYLLHARTNLLCGAWVPVATNAGTGAAAEIAVPVDLPARFFRLEAALP